MKMITLFVSLLLTVMAGHVAAQDVSADGGPVVPEFMQLDTADYLLAFVFFMMALTIIILYISFNKLVRSMVPAAPRKEKKKAPKSEAKEKKPGLWTRFDRKFLTRGVPVEKEADVLMHHDYDGIRELDNKLPPWWVWSFYITIIWACFYMLHFHVSGTGKSSAEEYEAEMASAAMEKEELMRMNADLVTAENVTMLTDAGMISAGKEIYKVNCAVCHLESGGGQVGPNLTDDHYIHGGGMGNLFEVISEGVPAKGMIAWKAQLTPKQIQQVSSYLMTLIGTNPPGAKEPQGELWTAEDDGGTQAPAAAGDSIAAPGS